MVAKKAAFLWVLLLVLPPVKSSNRGRPTRPLDRRIASRPESMWLNVVDYGAKGDNSTDNTAAFTAALSAASAAALPTLYLNSSP